MSPASRDPDAHRKQLENLDPLARRPELRNRRAGRHLGHAEPTPGELNPYEREIEEQLAGETPLREGSELPPADREAVRNLARDRWRLDNVRAWNNLHGVVEERTGQVKPSAQLEVVLSRRVTEQLEALGLTPRGRVKLGLDLARTTDLTAALSEPDDDRRRDLLREAGLDPGGDE